MAKKEKCYHCPMLLTKEERKTHNCWTTTEEALTRELPEDLRDAWERLREFAGDLGEQRIYASHKSIMFSRKSCYFFVRPKSKYLEVCIFLHRTVKHPRVQKIHPVTKTKVSHLIRIIHRDEVESPFTEWIREAYQIFDEKPAPVPKRKKTSAGRSIHS